MLNRLPSLKTRVNLHVSKEQAAATIQAAGAKEKITADVKDALPLSVSGALLADLNNWGTGRGDHEKTARSLTLGFYFSVLRHVAIQTRDYESHRALCERMSIAIDNVPYGDFFNCCLPALEEQKGGELADITTACDAIAPARSAQRDRHGYEHAFIATGINPLSRSQLTIVSLVDPTSIFASAILPRIVAAMYHQTEHYGSGSREVGSENDDCCGREQFNPFAVYSFEEDPTEMISEKFLLQHLSVLETTSGTRTEPTLVKSHVGRRDAAEPDLCGTLMRGHAVVFVDNSLLPAFEQALLPPDAPNVRSLFVHRLVFLHMPRNSKTAASAACGSDLRAFHANVRVLRPLYTLDVFDAPPPTSAAAHDDDADTEINFFPAWEASASAAQACGEVALTRRERDLAARRVQELQSIVVSAAAPAPAPAPGEVLMVDDGSGDSDTIVVPTPPPLPPATSSTSALESWMAVEPPSARFAGATCTSAVTAAAVASGIPPPTLPLSNNKEVDLAGWDLDLDLDDFLADVDFPASADTMHTYMRSVVVRYSNSNNNGGGITGMIGEADVWRALAQLSQRVANPHLAASQADLFVVSSNVQFLLARWDWISERFAQPNDKTYLMTLRLAYMAQRTLLRDMQSRIGYAVVDTDDAARYSSSSSPARGMCDMCLSTDQLCPVRRTFFWKLSCREPTLDIPYTYCARCLFALTYEAQPPVAPSSMRCACLAHCMCANTVVATPPPTLSQTETSISFIVGMEMFSALSHHLSFRSEPAPSTYDVVALFLPPVATRAVFEELQQHARDLCETGVDFLALVNHPPAWAKDSFSPPTTTSTSPLSSCRRNIEVRFYGRTLEDSFPSSDSVPAAAGGTKKNQKKKPKPHQAVADATATPLEATTPRSLANSLVFGTTVLLCVPLLDRDVNQLRDDLARTDGPSVSLYSFISSRTNTTTDKNLIILDQIARMSVLVERL